MEATTPGFREAMAKDAIRHVTLLGGAVGALWTLGSVLVSGWSALPAVLPWLGWAYIALLLLTSTVAVWRRDPRIPWRRNALSCLAGAGLMTLGVVLFDGVFLTGLGVFFLVSWGGLGVQEYLSWMRRRKLKSELEPTTKTCPECAETVKAAARKCRYCGHRFASEQDAGGATPNV